MNKKQRKEQRLTDVNFLIKIISSYGRRFFYDPKSGRIARMVLDERGRLWFVDDYSDKHIYIAKGGFSSRWRGFSHGGTLRSLIEHLRDYIIHGTPINPGYLGMPYTYQEGNHWGYTEDSINAVRSEALKLPIFSEPIRGLSQ